MHRIFVLIAAICVIGTRGVAQPAKSQVPTDYESSAIPSLARAARPSVENVRRVETTSDPADLRPVAALRSRANHSRRGAVIGAVVGALAGAIVGTQVQTGCDLGSTSCSETRNRIGLVGYFGVVGAGAGALLGALIESLSHTDSQPAPAR